MLLLQAVGDAALQFTLQMIPEAWRDASRAMNEHGTYPVYFQTDMRVISKQVETAKNNKVFQEASGAPHAEPALPFDAHNNKPGNLKVSDLLVLRFTA